MSASWTGDESQEDCTRSGAEAERAAGGRARQRWKAGPEYEAVEGRCRDSIRLTASESRRVGEGVRARRRSRWTEVPGGGGRKSSQSARTSVASAGPAAYRRYGSGRRTRLLGVVPEAHRIFPAAAVRAFGGAVGVGHICSAGEARLHDGSHLEVDRRSRSRQGVVCAWFGWQGRVLSMFKESAFFDRSTEYVDGITISNFR